MYRASGSYSGITGDQTSHGKDQEKPVSVSVGYSNASGKTNGEKEERRKGIRKTRKRRTRNKERARN